MTETVRVDDLEVEVRRSARRRTVDLIVDRSGNLVISVPGSLNSREIEDVIRGKQTWIYSTLGKKERALHSKVDKEYVTGEGFYYLGKKYRLKVVKPGEAQDRITHLCLKNGRFMLPAGMAGEGEDYFVRWYTKQGERWIVNAVESLKERVAADPKSVRVRDLKFRWGSCSSSGIANFHWRVMLLPPRVVHYLILHELAHLHEHNHSRAFYARLERAVPNHLELEAWLEENGDKYVL